MSSSMNSKTLTQVVSPSGILKCPTGIVGLDEITQGGLPRGRTDAVMRRRRLRKDFAGNGIPGTGRYRIRRTWRLSVF